MAHAQAKLFPILAPLLLLLLVGCGIAPTLETAAAGDRDEPTGLGALVPRPGAHASAAPETLHQAYELLLDRFVGPVDPSGVLQAAADGVLDQAARSRPAEWERPRATLPPRGSRQESWARFASWFESLVTQTAPHPDRPTLEQAALDAMARSLGERHTRHMSAPQYQEYLARRRGEGRYVGIGVRLRGGTPTVTEVEEGSPAEEAGLRRGDVFLAIDGAPTEGSLEGAAARLRGEVGVPVDLLIRRPGQAEPIRVTVPRQSLRMVVVRSRLLEGPIGYVQLRGFPEPGVVDEVSRALAYFDTNGIRGVIVDLRGNPGGRLDLGVALTSRFVRNGPIYQQVDRMGQRRMTEAAGAYWERSAPLAVLVDGGTASMAEIFASALQEGGAARLFGTRTSGSVAAARVFPLADGSALQVTVLEIVSGRGAVLNGVGLMPDEVVEDTAADLQLSVDAPLQAALAYLRRLAMLDGPSPDAALATPVGCVSAGPFRRVGLSPAA